MNNPSVSAQLAKGGLTPKLVEGLWQTPTKASGSGAMGLSAALWDMGDRLGTLERRRPACGLTHVISVWTRGSTQSELYLDNRKRFKLLRSRGTFQLARAGEELRVLLSESKGNCLDLYLPQALLLNVIETEFDRAASSLELLPIKLETDPIITRLADDIAAELQNPGLASRAAIDSAALMLSVCLIRRWSNQASHVQSSNAGLPDWQVRRVVDYMLNSMSVDSSLAELAAQVNLSSFHFARAFKASVGVPPHQYQVSLRLSRAREMLETTNLPIQEIASRVGYGDTGYFGRAFKREYAVAPGLYRRTRRS